MSFVALVTERFDQVVEFYGERLGFPAIDTWDRPGARGVRFDTGGLRLEIIDNLREQEPRPLGDPEERLHLIVEVVDIEAVRARLTVESPAVSETSWGARLFRIRDPDNIPVTFLEWIQARGDAP